MSCTDAGPFVGGTYINPVINEPTVSGGSFKGIKLTDSVSLDANVASQLLQAIQEASPVMVTDDPKKSTGDDLPAAIVGEDRSVLLGKPAGFIKLGGYMIPVFRAK